MAVTYDPRAAPEVVKAPDIEAHEIVHRGIGRDVVMIEMAAAVMSLLMVLFVVLIMGVRQFAYPQNAERGGRTRCIELVHGEPVLAPRASVLR